MEKWITHEISRDIQNSIYSGMTTLWWTNIAMENHPF